MPNWTKEQEKAIYEPSGKKTYLFPPPQALVKRRYLSNVS